MPAPGLPTFSVEPRVPSPSSPANPPPRQTLPRQHAGSRDAPHPPGPPASQPVSPPAAAAPCPPRRRRRRLSRSATVLLPHKRAAVVPPPPFWLLRPPRTPTHAHEGARPGRAAAAAGGHEKPPHFCLVGTSHFPRRGGRPLGAVLACWLALGGPVGGGGTAAEGHWLLPRMGRGRRSPHRHRRWRRGWPPRPPLPPPYMEARGRRAPRVPVTGFGGPCRKKSWGGFLPCLPGSPSSTAPPPHLPRCRPIDSVARGAA